MSKLPALLVASVLVVAACGDDGGTADTTSTTAAPGGTPTTPPASTAPTVPTTTLAPRPTLPKPSVAPPASEPTQLVVTDLTEGAGEPAAAGDTVVVHYVGVRSRDGVEFDNSYESGQPFPVELGTGGVIPGWEQGLVGVKTGGQRRLDIPSELAYGERSQGDVIGPNEDLTFVIDVLAVVKPVDPALEPKLVIAPSVAVPEVVPVDLIEGTGAVAEAGATATFSYIFYRADTGQQLYSSWADTPATVPLIEDGSIDGLVQGIVGMRVGGRRQITIPALLVFRGQGNEGLGLPAGTDLVMVADLLATY